MSEVTTCPIDGCEYQGSPSSVEAHISGNTDVRHRGEVGQQYRHALEQSTQGEETTENRRGKDDGQGEETTETQGEETDTDPPGPSTLGEETSENRRGKADDQGGTTTETQGEETSEAPLEWSTLGEETSENQRGKADDQGEETTDAATPKEASQTGGLGMSAILIGLTVLVAMVILYPDDLGGGA